MNYFSTNNKAPKVDFMTATIGGLAPDMGLYFPEYIPKLNDDFIKDLRSYANEEIAIEVIKPYVGGSIPEAELLKIVTETIDFKFPLRNIKEKTYALELFHGPTLAFKDVGARFMSRCLGYFVRGANRKVTVLVATSGDTGGAVADGFYNVEGVEVVILYPKGMVSNIQELQLTTHGKNIRAIEVDGTFDDCQRLVKKAFTDTRLNEKLFLTSANSINVARWLPQQFYYFFAIKSLPEAVECPVISVPSGNFGNICAGLLAHISGLPVKHFIAACNANDTVPNYLSSMIYQPKQSVSTISNAMDVGDPSNFIRILRLFKDDFLSLKEKLTSYTFTDAQTKECMKKLYHENNYVADPHGAVAYLGLAKYLAEHKGEKGASDGIFLETAHPVKFLNVVEEVLEKGIDMPEGITNLLSKNIIKTSMNNDFEQLKDFLISI